MSLSLFFAKNDGLIGILKALLPRKTKVFLKAWVGKRMWIADVSARILPVPVLWLEIAKLQMLYNNYSDALNCVEKVLKKKPELQIAIFLRAVIHLKLGAVDLALVDLGSLNYSTFLTSAMFKDLLNSLRMSGEIELALRYAIDYVSMNPSDAELKSELATLYSIKGRNDLAIQTLEDALTLMPDNIDIFRLLGRLYFVTKNEDKLRSLMRLAEINIGGKPDSYNVQAALYAKLGDYGQAVEMAKIALDMTRLDRTTIANYIRYMAGAGRLRETLDFLIHMIKIFPSYFIEDQYFFFTAYYVTTCGDYTSLSELDSVRKNLIDLPRQKRFASKDIQIFAPEWVSNIGHMATLDCHVKMARLINRSEELMVLYVPRAMQIGNSTFFDYWSQFFRVIHEPSDVGLSEKELWCFSVHYLSFPTFDGKNLPWYEAWGLIQKQWENKNYGPVLKLRECHLEDVVAIRKKIGLRGDDWFVCLHVREPGYGDQWNDPRHILRDADILSYLPAIKHIVDRGGWVIRMGDRSVKPLPKMDGLFDYARSEFRSATMDIVLSASCRFFLGSSSGLRYVASDFGIPCLTTNVAHTGASSFARHDLYIPKLYKNVITGNFASFAELLTEPLGFIHDLEVLSKLSWEIIDNSPDDILAVTEEMIKRLDGSIVYTEEESELQAKYLDLAEQVRSFGSIRIGNDFLQKYKQLL